MTMMRMPGVVAARDRVGDLGPRRVVHRDQAEEAELALGVARAGGQRAFGEAAPAREREHAQPLPASARPPRRSRARSSARAAAPRRRPSMRVQQRAAPPRARPWCGRTVARRRGVERRHQLAAAGRSGTGGGAARSRAVGVDVGAERRARAQQRDLGRVAASAPSASSRSGVVARRDRRPPSREAQRSRSARLGARRVELDLASAAVQTATGSHPVLGQRAGLVGADHVGRAERLHRAQPLDERAAARERAHGDGERERDHRQQPLGDVAGEQPDGEHDARPTATARRRRSRPGRRRPPSRPRRARSARRPGAPGARAGWAPP